jgi:hypothetical protein
MIILFPDLVAKNIIRVHINKVGRIVAGVHRFENNNQMNLKIKPFKMIIDLN